MASIKFTTKDIFEQDFKIGFRGYEQDEVNDFLDEIMKDYDAYEAIIKELKGEIARLKAQMANTPRVAVSGLEDSDTLRTERTSSATNFDILRRLNRLEKEVFGKHIAQEN
ncbi:cell division regulator GpsB [Streptococcus acidominimus]|uniref:Cell cycle protein GpsB n=1 Tax=Streptococcus acidominimus TaxID=1326 RepID=A0A1Q8EER8_STRAI|nr:cell division regulator GpsB [Streptococcus acidominimus]MBF0849170.1 cell division regulator GpsB [Streptococcus danieliae]MBF0818814.1 cell division regulator GpsB [Streptococcus acidominimus]MBF0839189.1 cell division regulator GpsB [Streptococcus acidominimus]OLF50299.1 cell division protein GpsB [Streptococcus acidominimus]TFU30764.1 cell division regulator GpsB [Streptococcus acidominimus]